jgi:alpha-galactosidase
MKLTRVSDTLPIYRQQIILQAKQQLTLNALSLFVNYNYTPQDQILCNGFQSWTETREFLPHEKIKTIARAAQNIVGVFGDYAILKEWKENEKGLPAMPDLYSWSYAHIRPPANNKQNIYFIGSLSEKTGYTAMGFDVPQNRIIVNKDISKRQLLPNETFVAMDMLIGVGTEANLWAYYHNMLTPNLPQTTPCAGWTSWYNYYTDISEEIVLRDTAALAQKEIPATWIQIDDGWQTAIGDWLVPNNKFKNGMRFLVQQIEAKGYKAGLWLAPFICTAQSAIYKEHPECLLRDEQGKLVTAGYNPLWRSWLYVLDWQRHDVQQYLQEVMDMVCRVWGFRLLKLDFLYAAALLPTAQHTRAELMFQANALLRRWAGKQTTLLACGTPLAPAFGVFDYCRIGADVHLSWEMPLLKWLNSRERVSTVLSLHNTINRRQLNQTMFGNDPDVSILRSTNNKLSQAEQYTLWLLNQIFGSVQFISDNIGEYDAATLHRYLSQFPIKNKQIERVKTHGQSYEIHFTIGKLHYLAFANLGEKAFEARLHSPQKMIYFDCKHQVFIVQAEICLQAHESICLLCTNTDQINQIAGSTGHLFAGSEIDAVNINEKGEIDLQISPECKNPSIVYMTTPNGIKKYQTATKAIAPLND